jgi:hypothetical protein
MLNDTGAGCKNAPGCVQQVYGNKLVGISFDFGYPELAPREPAQL